MSKEKALQGIDYAMDWKHRRPDAVQFATGLADARQWIIDAAARLRELEARLPNWSPLFVGRLAKKANSQSRAFSRRVDITGGANFVGVPP